MQTDIERLGGYVEYTIHTSDDRSALRVGNGCAQHSHSTYWICTIHNHRDLTELMSP